MFRDPFRLAGDWILLLKTTLEYILPDLLPFIVPTCRYPTLCCVGWPYCLLLHRAIDLELGLRSSLLRTVSKTSCQLVIPELASFSLILEPILEKICPLFEPLFSCGASAEYMLAILNSGNVELVKNLHSTSTVLWE